MRPEQITDFEALTIIADASRIRIYEILHTSGPMNVSALASEAGIAVGSASHHLRMLHRGGFVEPVDGPKVDRRAHWWRAKPGGLRWSPADFMSGVGEVEVATAFQRALVERSIDRVRSWLTGWQEWSPEWVDASLNIDAIINLTPEELAELGAGISRLLRETKEKSARRSADNNSADNNAEARPVFTFVFSFPLAQED